jgi:toxin FitB
MNWLVDTNVISETKKSKESPEVMAWVSAAPLKSLFTSNLNLAELVYGAAKLTDIARRRDIETWIEQIVRPWFAERTVEIDEKTLVRWRILTRQLDGSGNPAPATDLLMAAVAFENQLGVATRDTAPFAVCGIPTINPWTGERFNGA